MFTTLSKHKWSSAMCKLNHFSRIIFLTQRFVKGILGSSLTLSIKIIPSQSLRAHESDSKKRTTSTFLHSHKIKILHQKNFIMTFIQTITLHSILLSKTLFYSYNNLTPYGTRSHLYCTVFLTPAYGSNQGNKFLMNAYKVSSYLTEASFILSNLAHQHTATFLEKRTGDNETFKLLLFFISNGCSPEVIAKWILTS